MVLSYSDKMGIAPPLRNKLEAEIAWVYLKYRMLEESFL